MFRAVGRREVRSDSGIAFSAADVSPELDIPDILDTENPWKALVSKVQSLDRRRVVVTDFSTLH